MKLEYCAGSNGTLTHKTFKHKISRFLKKKTHSHAPTLKVSQGFWQTLTNTHYQTLTNTHKTLTNTHSQGFSRKKNGPNIYNFIPDSWYGEVSSWDLRGAESRESEDRLNSGDWRLERGGEQRVERKVKFLGFWFVIVLWFFFFLNIYFLGGSY